MTAEFSTNFRLLPGRSHSHFYDSISYLKALSVFANTSVMEHYREGLPLLHDVVYKRPCSLFAREHSCGTCQ